MPQMNPSGKRALCISDSGTDPGISDAGKSPGISFFGPQSGHRSEHGPDHLTRPLAAPARLARIPRSPCQDWSPVFVTSSRLRVGVARARSLAGGAGEERDPDRGPVHAVVVHLREEQHPAGPQAHTDEHECGVGEHEWCLKSAHGYGSPAAVTARSGHTAGSGAGDARRGVVSPGDVGRESHGE